MTTTTKPGTPLVTEEEVDEWREQLRLLKEQKVAIDRQVSGLEEKLNAAQIFIRARAAANIASSVEQREPALLPPPTTMQDTVLRILTKNSAGLAPKQISNVIRLWPELSPKIKNAHPNYIYTVLMRLANMDKITKDGTVYKLVEKKTAAS